MIPGGLRREEKTPKSTYSIQAERRRGGIGARLWEGPSKATRCRGDSIWPPPSFYGQCWEAGGKKGMSGHPCGRPKGPLFNITIRVTSRGVGREKLHKRQGSNPAHLLAPFLEAGVERRRGEVKRGRSPKGQPLLSTPPLPPLPLPPGHSLPLHCNGAQIEIPSPPSPSPTSSQDPGAPSFSPPASINQTQLDGPIILGGRPAAGCGAFLVLE